MPLQLSAKIPVRKAGYEWSDSSRRASLVANDPNAAGLEITPKTLTNYRFYDPFHEEPALFRFFAALDVGEIPENCFLPPDQPRLRNLVRKFTDKYGSLNFEIPANLDNFCWQVLTMRAAIGLWEAVRSENRLLLKDFLHWESGDNTKTRQRQEKALRKTITTLKAAYIDILPNFPEKEPNPDHVGWCLDSLPLAVVLGCTNLPSSNLTAENKKDPFPWAKQVLRAVIEKMIGEELRLGLCVSLNEPLILELKTNGLLVALWLQFALAVSENKEYQECRHCGRPFELAPQTTSRQARSDKSYCSATCRVQAMTQRKKLARNLFAQKKKIPAIAKEVGSSVEIVRKWVAVENQSSRRKHKGPEPQSKSK